MVGRLPSIICDKWLYIGVRTVNEFLPKTHVGVQRGGQGHVAVSVPCVSKHAAAAAAQAHPRRTGSFPRPTHERKTRDCHGTANEQISKLGCKREHPHIHRYVFSLPPLARAQVTAGARGPEPPTRCRERRFGHPLSRLRGVLDIPCRGCAAFWTSLCRGCAPNRTRG